ncbi:MAG: XRE family transcriptional regulator [Actinobacteria bacterium]|nr:XRE family transcriptional regulator [Actinomycetota bacterium]
MSTKESGPNERLRAALSAKGITYELLAQEVQVDEKTVERWVTTGRQPHRRFRLSVAALVQPDANFLWPGAASEAQVKRAGKAEFVEFYPSRTAVAPETWMSLISQAQQHIDVLAYGASFLHDSVPNCVELLRSRASQGVEIRLLLGDPESAAVALRGQEEKIRGMMRSRCEHTWQQFSPLLDEANVTVAQHGATLYNSIFRFDDDLLANTHVYGSPASHNPIIHLRRMDDGTVFSGFMDGFERTWKLARSSDSSDVADVREPQLAGR